MIFLRTQIAKKQPDTKPIQLHLPTKAANYADRVLWHYAALQNNY